MISKKNRYAHVLYAAMMQFSLKKGLQEWSEHGQNAAIKEMKQHHDIKTFFPVHAHDLTSEQ